jgi:hypothetical protein
MSVIQMLRSSPSDCDLATDKPGFYEQNFLIGRLHRLGSDGDPLVANDQQPPGLAKGYA